MTPLTAATLFVFGLGVYAYSPLSSALGWMLEDGSWALGLTSASLLKPRGLTGWTWTLVSTPQASHLLSFLLHIIITGLVGLYAYRVGLPLLTAWAAGVMLFLHPLSVETVAYAASRAEQIAAIGILLACLAATLRAWWKWPLVMVAVAIAVLGKDSGIVALGLVPLTLWMIGRPWQLPAVLFLCLGSAGVWVRYGSLYALANFPDYATQVGALEWALPQATATIRILITSVTGMGMTPDFDYDRLPMATQVGSLALVVGLGLMAAVSNSRILRFSVGGMLIALALRFVVQTPTSYLNEHQFFTAFIWLSLGSAAGIMAVGKVLYAILVVGARWAAAWTDGAGASRRALYRNHDSEL